MGRAQRGEARHRGRQGTGGRWGGECKEKGHYTSYSCNGAGEGQLQGARGANWNFESVQIVAQDTNRSRVLRCLME